MRTRSGPSKETQPAQQGIALTFAQYGLHAPIGLVHGDASRAGCFIHFYALPPAAAPDAAVAPPRRRALFDAIISDPPYGIRERSATLDDAPLTSRTLAEAQREGHVPRTATVGLETILSDLFRLAGASLVPGGRLVFLLPCTLPLAESLALLPPHPDLEVVGASEQRMAARWSRWCLTMRRVADGQADGQAGGQAGGQAAAGQAAALPALPCFRSAIFDPLRRAAEGPVLHPALLEKVARRRACYARPAESAAASLDSPVAGAGPAVAVAERTLSGGDAAGAH